MDNDNTQGRAFLRKRCPKWCSSWKDWPVLPQPGVTAVVWTAIGLDLRPVTFLGSLANKRLYFVQQAIATKNSRHNFWFDEPPSLSPRIPFYLILALIATACPTILVKGCILLFRSCFIKRTMVESGGATPEPLFAWFQPSSSSPW